MSKHLAILAMWSGFSLAAGEYRPEVCDAGQAPRAAAGAIYAVEADLIRDGDYFTLHDGIRQSTFEFDTGDGVAAGNIDVFILHSEPGIQGDSSRTVALRLHTIIRTEYTQGRLDIDATLSRSRVILTNGRKGVIGNQPIGHPDKTNLTYEGMAGGIGRDCFDAVGCNTSTSRVSRN